MSDARFESKSPLQVVSENYFETNYPPLPLPMIWRVIYHEAMRGNHLLWDKVDLDEIEATVTSPNFKVNPEDKHLVTHFMAKFLSTISFMDLQTMVKSLSHQQKALVFILYRRAISTWQTWLKTHLH